jgi:hypothetical protein
MSPTDWLVTALAAIPTAPPRQARRVVRDGSTSKAACKAAGVSASALWLRLHPERIDRVKRAQKAREWREQRIRPGWLAYCAAYRERFTVGHPMGFGRWMGDKHYRTWASDPDQLLAAPNTRNSDTARAILKA